MARNFLVEHAYVCVTDGHAVILDLRRDSYFAVSKTQTRALVGLIEGWPRLPGSHSAATADEQDVSESALQALRRKGLLATQPSSGKSAAPVRVARPQTALLGTSLLHTLLDGPAVRPPQVRIVDLAAFLLAYGRASHFLTHRRLPQFIEHVRKRHALTIEEPKVDLLRKHVHRFRLIRPFVYTSSNRCLFDSLVLVEYLACYDIYPLWVFGVTARPFAAHSWVQHGNLVLNDTPEHVGQFTPIMVA